MEMGNPKILAGGAIVTVVAAVYLVISLRPTKKSPVATKAPMVAAKVSDSDIAPTDVFGAPVRKDDPSGPDLGFGTPNPIPKSPDGGLATVPPTKPDGAPQSEGVAKAATETPQPPHLRGKFSPSSNPEVPSPVTLPIQMAPGVVSPAPADPAKAEPDRALQPPKKSVIIKAIVRIDSDAVAYIGVDGKVNGYHTASSIGGNIKVKKITDEGVTLECNGKAVTLPVGGSEDI